VSVSVKVKVWLNCLVCASFLRYFVVATAVVAEFVPIAEGVVLAAGTVVVVD